MPRSLLISSRCAQTIYAQRRALALAAVAAGWRVSLAGDSTPGDPYPSRLQQLGLPFEALPVRQRSMNPFRLVGLFSAYRSLMRRLRPDVFHAFTIKPTIVGLIAARAAGVPVRLATVAGLGHIFLSSSRLVHATAVRLFKVSLAQAHRVIFYNAEDRDLFERLGILPPGSALLIPGSGVDTERFAVAPLPDGNPLVLLFIGRLLREKGIRELLEAARLLRERQVDVRLELLGDVDANNPSSLTRAELDDAVASGGVHWHGATDDVRPFIARAHVMVLPSYREGIPLSLLEGAAMGRALVSTDVAGCRDVVRDGVTGRLVGPQDPVALAQAIEQLAADRALIHEMGRAARADAEERFSAAIVTRRVLDEYDRLIGEMRR